MSTDTIEHIATPDEHSDIVGGSSAARVIGCPASVRMLAKIPESVRNSSSSYADEGTALHEIMVAIIDRDEELPLDDLIQDPAVDALFDKYELKDERFFDAVVPAYRQFLAFLDEVYETDPDAEVRIRCETRVQMPGIDNAFGTCDLLIQVISSVAGVSKTVVWDWKFGSGVPVYASYKITYIPGPGERAPTEDPGSPETTEYGNDQLTFYARAAQNSLPDYFGEGDDYPVELVICQPRILEDEPARYMSSIRELEDFRLDLIDAVDEAINAENPTMRKDDKWCRFAACKTICPLHFNAPRQMVEVGEKLAKLQLARSAAVTDTTQEGEIERENLKVDYAEALATMLQLKEIAEPYFLEAERQAHAFMEAGGTVPGHKLVPKRAAWDGWEDPEDVDKFLGRRGLDTAERRKPTEPISPAQARKVLKAKGDEKGLTLLEKYVKKGVSSGTTVAPSDDPRPTIEPTAASMAMLTDKLASFT